ncbi:MAG TPA: hypothetical protein VIW28_03055 [Gemmatimonadales bacterium]
MRMYAVVLGIGLTTFYGYAGQVAVASLHAVPNEASHPAPRHRAHEVDRVWYGGTLAPVVVEATRARLAHGRPTVRCHEPSQAAPSRAAT